MLGKITEEGVFLNSQGIVGSVVLPAGAGGGAACTTAGWELQAAAGEG